MTQHKQPRYGTPEDYYTIPEGESPIDLGDAFNLTMCRAKGVLNIILNGLIEQEEIEGGPGNSFIGHTNIRTYQDLASGLQGYLDQLDKLADALTQHQRKT